MKYSGHGFSASSIDVTVCSTRDSWIATKLRFSSGQDCKGS